jgi:hypothetical protein
MEILVTQIDIETTRTLVETTWRGLETRLVEVKKPWLSMGVTVVQELKKVKTPKFDGSVYVTHLVLNK